VRFKTAIVRATDAHLAPRVPREAPVIIDWGQTIPNTEMHEAWVLHHVAFQIVSVDDFESPAVAAACELGGRVLLRMTRRLSVAEALRMAAVVRRENFEVELTLEDSQDVVALQILSSLGVQLRIDVHVFASGRPWLTDLLQDQILQPGPRQPAAPLGQLVADAFQNATQIAAWDLRHNDWHVDLRTNDLPTSADDWHVPDLATMHVPQLTEPTSCTFCEGFLWCNGYLLSDKTAERQPACQDAFATFVKLLNLQWQASGKSGRGNGA
jgi:hypothetical protein